MIRANHSVIMRAVVALLYMLVAAGRLHSQEGKSVLRGRVEGTVWDSTRAQPLVGSVVQLVNASDRSSSRSATTDERGRFRFDSLLPGGWIIGALHQRLDSLAIAQITQSVTVKSRGTTKVRLVVPSGGTLSQQVCRASPLDSTGYLFGTLRRADGDRRPTTGTVRVEWLELLISAESVTRQAASQAGQAAADGTYLVCGVPASAITRVQAWSGPDSTGAFDIEFPKSGIVNFDLSIGRTRYVREQFDSTVSSSDTSAFLWLRRGSGRVAGILLDPLGRPLPNAIVGVAGTGRSARTNDAGRFELVELPSGTQLFEARALGFEPLRTPVNIIDADTTTVSYALSRLVMLDTVKVRAIRAAAMGRDMVAFENRRRLGNGKFFGPDELNAIDPIRFSDLVWRVPGVRVVPVMGGDRILMRGFGLTAYCSPDIWLDGMRLANDGSMDSFISPQWLRAVEVYARSEMAPAQYTGMSGCGVILLWSGSREIPGAVKK